MHLGSLISSLPSNLPFDLPTPISTAPGYDPTASSWTAIIWYVLLVISLWPIFVKAGRPGWGAIIPIYNLYLFVKVAGYHGALVILYFIPIVNIVVSIIVSVGVAKAFGKGGAFGFFLVWLLSLIGYFILGYGGARYVGRGGQRNVAPTAA